MFNQAKVVEDSSSSRYNKKTFILGNLRTARKALRGFWQMKIIDNFNSLLGDDLKASLPPKSKLKVAASCFSIYAYEALKTELSKIESLEFIFTVKLLCAKFFQEINRKIDLNRVKYDVVSSYGKLMEIVGVGAA